MSLSIRVEYVGDVAVIRPEGKLTIGVGEVALRDTIAELTLRGHSKVLLVLSRVSTVDSAGLHELVHMYTKIHGAGGRVVFTEIPRKLNDIFEITQLYSIFEVADTVDEGLDLLRS